MFKNQVWRTRAAKVYCKTCKNRLFFI